MVLSAECSGGMCSLSDGLGTSLAIQWLGVRALTAEGWGLIPQVRELRSHKPQDIHTVDRIYPV